MSSFLLVRRRMRWGAIADWTGIAMSLVIAVLLLNLKMGFSVPQTSRQRDDLARHVCAPDWSPRAR
jgi:hypothetical protein